MSGMYGTVKPANINIDKDVEIFYHYRPSLNGNDDDFTNFKKLDVKYLEKCKVGENNVINGLFNLKLPVDIFNKKGIYTIYIRPKEIDATIFDKGVLYAYPDVRGIVFEKNELSDFNGYNALVGYRIDYIDNNGSETCSRLITSSNIAGQIEKETMYQYRNDGRFIFCTVTPSLSTTFNPNNLPYIGNANDKVKIVNTNFNPIMLELELVEHDAETLSYMIEGNQLVDKDNAIITTFNTNGEIYHQSEYGAYKDDYGNPLYEFKKKRNNIDSSQNLDNLE